MLHRVIHFFVRFHKIEFVCLCLSLSSSCIFQQSCTYSIVSQWQGYTRCTYALSTYFFFITPSFSLARFLFILLYAVCFLNQTSLNKIEYWKNEVEYRLNAAIATTMCGINVLLSCIKCCTVRCVLYIS